jgi:hypothetical protein
MATATPIAIKQCSSAMGPHWFLLRPTANRLPSLVSSHAGALAFLSSSVYRKWVEPAAHTSFSVYGFGVSSNWRDLNAIGQRQTFR